MTVFYHVTTKGIATECVQKKKYTGPTDDTFTDLREAKRRFSQLSAAEIKRLQKMRKLIGAAKTREAIISIDQEK